MQIKRILCPVDFSLFSVAAYCCALLVAEHYQPNVICLHVAKLAKYLHADYGAYETDFAKFSKALNEGGEHQLKKNTGSRIEPDIVIQQRNASDSILSFAETHGIELIVMETHGRRGVDRLVLGSTTDHVIRSVPCSVLMISNPSQTEMCTGSSNWNRARF